MPITRTMTGLRRSPRLTSRRKQQKKKSNTRTKTSKTNRTKTKARKTRRVQRKASKTRKARRTSVSKTMYTKDDLSKLFERGTPIKHGTKCLHWKKTGLTPGSTLSVRSRCRARSPLYLNHPRSKKCADKWQYLSRDGKLKECYKGKGPYVRRRAK